MCVYVHVYTYMIVTRRYERTTLETVNMVQSIVSAGIADASRCCALLDKKEGLEVFQQDGWLPPGDDIDGAAW